jgi:hypothetical protein
MTFSVVWQKITKRDSTGMADILDDSDVNPDDVDILTE